MIRETEIQIHTSGLGLAMLKGMGSGIPYKIYAAWAGKLQFPFASFLILSVAARTLRFSLAVCATHLAAHTLKLKLSFGCIYGLYAFFWFSLYASYFYIFGF